MFAVLRNEAETVNRIKVISPDSALPRGVLLGGKLALQQSLCDFEAAAKADSPNLRRPPLPPEVEPAPKYSHRGSLDGGTRGDPVWDDEDEDNDEEQIRVIDR